MNTDNLFSKDTNFVDTWLIKFTNLLLKVQNVFCETKQFTKHGLWQGTALLELLSFQ